MIIKASAITLWFSDLDMKGKCSEQLNCYVIGSSFLCFDKYRSYTEWVF